jgi:hypothetical protein
MSRIAWVALISSSFVAAAGAEPLVETEANQAMAPTPLGVEETRNASGTAWQPDSSPMFMWHARSGDW